MRCYGKKIKYSKILLLKVRYLTTETLNMMTRFSAAIAIFASSALAYPSDEDRATVPEWDALAISYGFDYEMYTATTDDQWIL